MNKLKLKGITLETKNSKQISITIEEAEDLYKQLERLFGIKTAYVPYQPIYIEPYTWPKPYEPYITYETSNKFTVDYSTNNLCVSYTGDVV